MAEKDDVKRVGVSRCSKCGSITIDGKSNKTRLISMYRKPKKPKKDK